MQLKNKYVPAEALYKLLCETRRTPEEKCIVLLARLNGGHLTEQDCVAMRGAGAFRRTRSALRQKRECFTPYKDYNNMELEDEVCKELAPVEVKVESSKSTKRTRKPKDGENPGGDGAAEGEG
jgi:hypothetical protein